MSRQGRAAEGPSQAGGEGVPAQSRGPVSATLVWDPGWQAGFQAKEGQGEGSGCALPQQVTWPQARSCGIQV